MRLKILEFNLLKDFISILVKKACIVFGSGYNFFYFLKYYNKYFGLKSGLLFQKKYNNVFNNFKMIKFFQKCKIYYCLLNAYNILDNCFICKVDRYFNEILFYNKFTKLIIFKYNAITQFNSYTIKFLCLYSFLKLIKKEIAALKKLIISFKILNLDTIFFILKINCVCSCLSKLNSIFLLIPGFICSNLFIIKESVRIFTYSNNELIYE